jgi:hypothetical protein
VGHAYLLVDCALYPEMSRKPPLGIQTATLAVPGVDDEQSMAALPMLLAWPDDDLTRHWLLRRCISWAQDCHAVTWLRSRLGLRELAQALGRRMDMRHEDGTELLLRFADSRILPGLHRHLNDEQRAALFEPIERWWYLDRDDKLQAFPLEPCPSVQAAALPLVLTQAQINALMDEAEPDTVLALLDKMFPDVVASLPPPQRYGFVKHHLLKAHGLGMEASMDVAAFCAMALQRGSSYLESPQWRATVRQVHSGQSTWATTLTSDKAGDAR